MLPGRACCLVQSDSDAFVVLVRCAPAPGPTFWHVFLYLGLPLTVPAILCLACKCTMSYFPEDILVAKDRGMSFGRLQLSSLTDRYALARC